MPSLRQKWKSVKQRWKSNSDTSLNTDPSEHVELREHSSGQAPIPPASDTEPTISPDQGQPQARRTSNETVGNDQVQSQQEPIDSPAAPTAASNSNSNSEPETTLPTAQPLIQTPEIAEIIEQVEGHEPVEVLDLWAEAVKVLTDSEKRLLAKLQSEAGIEGSAEIQIDGLIDLTRSKQAECEQKLWKLKIGGREIVLRDVAETAISWLNTFKEVGDIAVQFDTTGAALPWAGFRFLVQLAVSDRDQMAGLLQAMERITRTVTRCRIYESLYSPTTTSEDAVKVLRAGIVGVYTAILSTLALSFDLFSRNTAARALYALFTPGQSTYLGTRLATLESELSLEVEMCENMRKAWVDDQVERGQRQLRELLARLKDQLSTINKATNEILRKMERDEQRNILEWFSSLPYALYHEELRETRAEHTCEWLLKHDKFKEWTASNVSPILWISGFPGSGKTFLVSKAIDSLKESIAWLPGTNTPNQRTQGFAFFYCSRHEEERRTPIAVLRSLLRQLSTTDSYPDRVHASLIAHHDTSKDKGSGLTISNCVELLQTLVGSYSNTTIFLDALDECDGMSRGRLMDAIDSILAVGGNKVKILVSSRPDVDIRGRFNNRPFIEIQSTDNQDDIAIFVNQEIVKHPRWSRMEAGLKSEVIKTLLEKSQGMFQWTYLQIRQLLEECRTPVAIRDRLGHLPKDLKVAYDEIYDKIQNRHEYERQLAQRAFRWVLFTATPIPTIELLQVVGQDPESGEFRPVVEVDEELLLELCCNLLVIDSQFKVWRLSHLSVAEYLETHHLSFDSHRLELAKVGLSWLLRVQGVESEVDPEVGSDVGSDVDSEVDYFRFGHAPKHHGVLRVLDSVLTRDAVAAISDREEQNNDIVLQRLLIQFVGSHDETSLAYRTWLARRWFDKRSHNQEHISSIDKPIFVASAYGLISVVKSWAEQGHIILDQTPPQDESLVPSHINLTRLSERGLTPLAMAAWNNHNNTCRALLAMGADANQLINHDLAGSALGWAARTDSYQVVSELIRLGANPNLILPGSCPTALAIAVSAGAFRSLKALIAAGALPQLPKSQGAQGALLADAIQSGDIRIIEALVEAGVDVNIDEKEGVDGSSLAVAIATGRLDMVSWLLKAGANINHTLHTGRTSSALETAVCFEFWSEETPQLISILLHAGADINLKTRAGNYGSSLAAAVSLPELFVFLTPPCVSSLLAAGAEVNMVLEAGHYGSALTAAAAHGNLHSMRLLLDHGANVNLCLEAGMFGSALIAAAWHLVSTIPLELLIQHGAEVNMHVKTGDFGSPLAAACVKGNLPAVHILLRHSANVNTILTVGGYGSVLAAAARSGDCGLISLILEHGANVNLILEFGDYGSALAAASWSGVPAAVELLLGAGADPNLPLSAGSNGSALTAAILHLDLDSVDLLIEAGADVNMMLLTGDYGSALAAAATVDQDWKEYDDEIMVCRLLKAGADANMPLNHGLFGSALVAAAAHRNMPATRLLLTAGADVNQQVDNRWFGNPLIAVIRGMEKITSPDQRMFGIITWLLRMGADPHAVSPAAHHSALQVVQELEANGSWPQMHISNVKLLFETVNKQPGSLFDSPADETDDQHSNANLLYNLEDMERSSSPNSTIGSEDQSEQSRTDWILRSRDTRRHKIPLRARDWHTPGKHEGPYLYPSSDASSGVYPHSDDGDSQVSNVSGSNTSSEYVFGPFRPWDVNGYCFGVIPTW